MNRSEPEPLDAALAHHHLTVLGGFALANDERIAGDGGTLLLIGPHEPGFWAAFQQTPEAYDGHPDPMDRWSGRVLGGVARALGGQALFPFGGPPYHPFHQWALRSGRAWASPVGMLVHAEAGLLVSFRGALLLPGRVSVPPPDVKPCTDCAERPCLGRCPVNALSHTGYDVAACHGWLDSAEGRPCLTAGCLARRACPVSERYARDPAQSAYHMERFHPA